MPHTAARTATHCRSHCRTQPHCRTYTAALPRTPEAHLNNNHNYYHTLMHTLPRTHTVALAHYCAMPYTAARIVTHCCTAAHCCLHFHRLPLALPQNMLHCRTLPHTAPHRRIYTVQLLLALPHTHCRSHCHKLPHCATLPHCRAHTAKLPKYHGRSWDFGDFRGFPGISRDFGYFAWFYGLLQERSLRLLRGLQDFTGF
jgi:hypothetical protein